MIDKTAPRPHRTMVYPDQKIAELIAENYRLRGISNLLARSLCGISPDSNTQTEAEVAATEDAIQNAIQEALQFHA